MNKVILVGYMAVGKTTIAQLVAQKMNYKLLDLDMVVQKKTNLSITDIFKQKGEIYFRRIEHEVFTDIINNSEKVIISTGGGTPCYSNNHLLLNGENIVSIYLHASIDLIFERLKRDKIERPIVADLNDDILKEFIAKNLFERSYFYNQATYKVIVDNKTTKEITEEIYQLLN
jgi:shikimate kinase